MLTKMKRPLVGLALLAFCTWPAADGSVSTAQKNMHPHGIGLQDAINKTLNHNPALKSLAYQLKAQRGRELQAGLSASPEFSLTLEDALGTGGFTGLDRMQATMGISWVVEGRIRQGYKEEAHARTLSLITDVDSKRLDAAAQTARLYLTCLANQARLGNAARNLELANETVKAVSQRVVAGRTSEAELARAEADREKKRLYREGLEHLLKSDIRLLAAQWGETDPGFTHVEGNILHVPNPMPFEVLKKRIEQSPAYLRLMADRRLKESRLRLEESRSRPEWKLNLGIRHFELSDDQAIVAGVAIPFGERARNPGNISAAREDLRQTQAIQAKMRVQLEARLFTLSQALQHSLHQADAYRERVIPRLETALEQTRRAYELGRYSYLEWRSVQAELLDARNALLESSFDAHLKIIEMERLTGISLIQPPGSK